MSDIIDEKFKRWFHANPVRSGYPPHYDVPDTWEEFRRKVEEIINHHHDRNPKKIRQRRCPGSVKRR